MFPSLEVRWFYQGALPGEVVDWFHDCEQEPEEQPHRLDYYLRLGTTDSLGIKLREGRIEVKQRVRQHGVAQLGERATGLVEHWRKWSFGLADAGTSFGDILVPVQSWIGVQKQRKLRKYQLAGDDRLLAVGAGEYPERGCAGELTAIRIEEQEWWSLGFEAFGEESSLKEILMLAVGQFLSRKRVPFYFHAEHSYGYPSWLARLEQGADSSS